MSSSSRTNPLERAERAERAGGKRTSGGKRSSGGRAGGAWGPWTVLCAVATVVLGPAAVTASALDQANAAPMHHAVRADPTQQAYIPSDLTRRRSTAA
ncbi:hypothetical protein [Streptomyces sp. NBC_00576]|uniref:hypothetical protein n=1 Tax=Streptomyces sp. NBC_00576 TaxID=2903665 RepID=UPI002E7FF1DD|nr:hypothetical protein [Streptomyces sp. NBC_00576]WUB75027.1 hypothetical protein OG734_36005 [Streptomyces sp. NBC_00576]